MKASLLLAGPLAVIGVTGCLASKGDIRLLQDELLATRTAVARSDSAHRREADSLTAALSAMGAAQARGDSANQQSFKQVQQTQLTTDGKLTDLATRVRNDELTTGDRFKTFADEINQLQELTRQNARNMTQAKAAVEQSRSVPPVAATPGDTTPRPTAAPGPATLLLDGNGAILQGSCRTARRSYEELLRLYPNAPEAADAQYKIAESFVSCAEGANLAAADSVYSLVVAKYPKSDQAATSLYKQAEMQTKAGKADAAKALYQRVFCEYPKTDPWQLAVSKLGTPLPRCK